MKSGQFYAEKSVVKMANELIGELEQAAKILLAPPNLITHEQRQSAEAVFLNFRKINSPYELCKQIFETCTTDYILFETAGLLKIALVQEWILLSKDDIASLRDYLLRYAKSKPRLAEYVRSRIVLVIVVIVKKGSVDDNGESRHALLNEAESLISSGDLPVQILGCNLLSTLMQEYALDVRSSDVGLTLETHFSQRRKFEVPDAQRIFQFANRALNELIEKDTNEAILTLMRYLLAVVESILVFGFQESLRTYKTKSGFLGIGSCDTTPQLILSVEWKNVILDPRMIDFFFRLYWKVRTNQQIAHHARTCLIQLAGLAGSVFENKDVEIQYLTEYWKGFSKLISSIEIIDQEAAGIAEIMKRLMPFHRFEMPESFLESFLRETMRLTCFLIEKSAQEESMCVDECLYTEALCPMLELGMCSVYAESSLGKTLPNSPEFNELNKEGCIQILNTYLRHHLFPPDGVRTIEEKELNEDDIDVEEDDKIRFKEQLQLIGYFARKTLHYALPLLAQLIENRTAKLSDRLNTLASQNNGMNKSDNNCMSALYEDIHWLILVTGHVLCLESRREVPVLPSEITRYSLEQREQGKVDVSATLQYLASSENVQMNLSNVSGSVDCVIRIIADVFRLSAIEKTAISVNLSEILSPELTRTIMWFLQRCSLNFILINEKYYKEISPTFLEAFGTDTPGANWVINFILERIGENINTFKSEPALMKATVDLLMALTHTETKSALIAQSERFGPIVELAVNGRCDFAPEIKRGLMNAVVQVGSAIPKSDEQEQFWSQVLSPLQNRFKDIVSNQNFGRSYHEDRVKVVLTDLLDSLIGVVKSVQYMDCQPVYRYISPVIVELPNLLSLYHNYQQIVQLILEFLCECACWITCDVSGDVSLLPIMPQFHSVCCNTIQSYSRFNSNRLSIEKTAEEDAFQDLFLLMQLVTNIVALHNNSNSTEQTSGSVTSADVFVCGLNTIMSIVTMDMIKFPALCERYFELILYVANTIPKKVFDLSPNLLQQLLMSIELGLTSFGYKAAGFSCQIIRALARHIYTKTKKDEPQSQLMAPYMNILMSTILSNQFHSGLISDVGSCLCALIHCYPDQYQQLVQNILSSQSNQTVHHRLAEEFTKLKPTIAQNDYHRLHERNFESKFENFIANVQGFLIVK